MQDDATSIAVADNGDIYVAWNTFGLGDWFAGDLYVAKSTDGGLSFGTPVRVNDTDYRARVWSPTFIYTPRMTSGLFCTGLIRLLICAISELIFRVPQRTGLPGIITKGVTGLT